MLPYLPCSPRLREPPPNREERADLANAAAKQDAGVLDNLSSLFSGGGAAAASQGSNLLGSLLGGLAGGFGPNRQRALALYRSERDCHQQTARLPGAGRVGCN